MEKSVRDLGDASELVAMLQHLCDAFADGPASGQRVPWNGFSLTLMQIRELIDSAREELGEQYSDGSAAAPRDTLPASSLADRVQHVPTTRTRARELIGSAPGSPKAPGKRAVGDVAEH